jgi:hypothetical protein
MFNWVPSTLRCYVGGLILIVRPKRSKWQWVIAPWGRTGRPFARGFQATYQEACDAAERACISLRISRASGTSGTPLSVGFPQKESQLEGATSLAERPSSLDLPYQVD